MAILVICKTLSLARGQKMWENAKYVHISPAWRAILYETPCNQMIVLCKYEFFFKVKAIIINVVAFGNMMSI